MTDPTPADPSADGELIALPATVEIKNASGGVLEPLDITGVFGDQSVYNNLPAEYRTRADELSLEIQVDESGADMTALRASVSEATTKLNETGKLLIDDSRIKDTGYVGDLMRDVKKEKDGLDLEALRAKPSGFTNFLLGLDWPWLDKLVHPVLRFKEDWEPVEGKIDGWIATLQQGYVDMENQDGFLQEAYTTNLQYFRSFDVAVAAAERALFREYQEFCQAVEAAESDESINDMVTLQGLNTRRNGLSDLARRAMRYQNSRARAQAYFPAIQQMQQRCTTVKQDIETLMDTVIPQWRFIVGLSIQNYRTRLAMKDSADLEALNAEFEAQLVEALALAADEEHEFRMQAATQGERIAQFCDGLARIAEKTLEHRNEQEAAFAASKATIEAALADLKGTLVEVLDRSVQVGDDVASSDADSSDYGSVDDVDSTS